MLMQRKLFHIFLSLITLLVVSSYACRKNNSSQNVLAPVNGTRPSNDTGKQVHDTTGYSFLALGDSYTIGASVKEDERFPAQTVQFLHSESGKEVTWLKYIATSGWTTSNLLNAIYQEKLKDTFDIVTLLIGVNDQYQQQDTTGYRDRFTTILKNAIRLAGNRRQHVFILSIPDYSVTPFASQRDVQFISKQIDQFNNINHVVANAYGITYIYITDISREALNDPSLIAFDGLHPSAKMYLRWVYLLGPEIARVLK